MSAPVLPDGYRLVHLQDVDSTNAEALRRALAGEQGPLWILADRQASGRGRDGRIWASLPGNLHASLLIGLDCRLQAAAQLSLVTGVAAVDAVHAAAGRPIPGLRLKWPNDILIGTAKVGGILIESTSPGRQGAGGSRLVAVIGVGVNLAAAPQDAARPATSLQAHGLTLSPHDALCFLADALHSWIGIWEGGAGFARVRAAWLDRAGAKGEAVTVHGPDGQVDGRFAGLDDDGALLVTGRDGRVLKVRFGDVTLN
jgi:BirA family biotin operon repressor/biotin-[acetyl-CoA-carboxylase] ligase